MARVVAAAPVVSAAVVRGRARDIATGQVLNVFLAA